MDTWKLWGKYGEIYSLYVYTILELRFYLFGGYKTCILATHFRKQRTNHSANKSSSQKSMKPTNNAKNQTYRMILAIQRSTTTDSPLRRVTLAPWRSGGSGGASHHPHPVEETQPPGPGDHLLYDII